MVYVVLALLVVPAIGSPAEERALYTYRVTVGGNPVIRIEADVMVTADDMDIRLRSPLTGTTRIEGTRCGMVWRYLSARSPGEKEVRRDGDLITIESTDGAITRRNTIRLEPTVVYPFPLLAGCVVNTGADEWFIYDPRADGGAIGPTRLVVGDVETIELGDREVRAVRVDAPESGATYWVARHGGIVLKWEETRRGTTYSGVLTGGL